VPRDGFVKIIMEQNRICALIPARSGSKGLVNKNKLPFAGSTLTRIALESACRSKLIADVALSTDDTEISRFAQQLKILENPNRPSHLSSDESNIVDVALDFLETQNVRYGKTWEFLMLLEPTAPLRTSEMLDQGISHFLPLVGQYDACISIGKLNFGLDSLFHLQDQRIVSLAENADPRMRRQDQRNLYFPFGIFYMIKVETLTKFKTFYPPNTLGFQVPDNVCIEIDTLLEFQIAEFLYEKRGSK
jgi:CMP-N,N'-diacetyllegionaminic acid synthase